MRNYIQNINIIVWIRRLDYYPKRPWLFQFRDSKLGDKMQNIYTDIVYIDAIKSTKNCGSTGDEHIVKHEN